MRRRRVESDVGEGEQSSSPATGPAAARSSSHRAAGGRPQDGGRAIGSAGQRINPTVSTAAIAEARNAIAAAQTSGDYRYQSVADLFRAALRAHTNGLRLTQQAKGGQKRRHTVERPAELSEHYEKLPSQSGA